MAVDNIISRILVSIVLTIIIVSLANVGMSIFLEPPKYEDYCQYRGPDMINTTAQCDAVGGKWTPDYSVPGQPTKAVGISGPNGYCDRDFTCRTKYDDAQKSYNQIRYYVFAGLGFILLIVGLLSAMTIVRLSGLATGAILLTEGIIFNFENKTIVFISLLLILILFGGAAWYFIENRGKTGRTATRKKKR